MAVAVWPARNVFLLTPFLTLHAGAFDPQPALFFGSTEMNPDCLAVTPAFFDQVANGRKATVALAVHEF
ncbi:MAG TPA: hypothetical protein DHE23_24100 [Agrobacterium sp.]|nr:hypothetical protein [Agrobacterium sp.]